MKEEEIKKDKGKGKMPMVAQEKKDISEEEDEDFDAQEQSCTDEINSSSDTSSEASFEESEGSLEEDDEIAGLLQEAEEFGDKGDLVFGLRSGKMKSAFVDSCVVEGSSSSKKRALQGDVSSRKHTKTN